MVNGKKLRVLNPPHINDLLAGVSFLLLVIICWFWLIPHRISVRSWAVVTIATNPTIYPKFIVVIIGLLTIMLLFSYFRALYGNSATKVQGKLDNCNYGKAIINYVAEEKSSIFLFLLFFVYSILIKELGFFISKIFFTVGFMCHLQVKNWKGITLLPLFITGFVYIIFSYFLSVRFPKGILF